MAISFKSAVAKAKKLWESGRYKKFSDAVKAAYKKGGGYKQTGSRSSLKADKKRKAKPPGKRKTSWGTLYTETRRNRSDRKGSLSGLSPLKRAEHGYASASLAYLKADTIAATKAAQKRKAKYARDIKRLSK